MKKYITPSISIFCAFLISACAENPSSVSGANSQRQSSAMALETSTSAQQPDESSKESRAAAEALNRSIVRYARGY
jgi:starvation-inducible outer membrane lipoprotein